MNAVLLHAKTEVFALTVSTAIDALVQLGLLERTAKQMWMTVQGFQTLVLMEEPVVTLLLHLYATVHQVLLDIVVRLAETYALTILVNTEDDVSIVLVATRDITASAYQALGVQGARKTSMNVTTTHA